MNRNRPRLRNLVYYLDFYDSPVLFSTIEDGALHWDRRIILKVCNCFFWRYDVVIEEYDLFHIWPH
jgi:hypothetical protein